MLKYAKISNTTTKECMVGLGTDSEYYKSIGMTLQDVEEAYNGNWYLKGYAPEKPLEVQLEEKEQEYQMNRWQREIILSHNSGASNYSKQKAQELENLAKKLRK